jgi:indole-3-glycerol phosphate synthase/phosphoribosylanthranilate isomerase
VVEARVAGADAVLLMLSVLNDDRYRRCAEMADRLAMGVLTEAHTADEIGRARALRARAIGINNRRLGDLTVDLVTTEALAAQAPVEAILIAESGIGRHQDVVRLRPHVDGFLVGTSLMKAADPDRTARGLIFGPTKICGLTRAEDAIAAATAGATHGGIVFAPRSRRRVAPALAAALSSDRTLDWVGVFLDQPVEELAELAAALGLAAVQLHGSEDQRYCAELRHRLPAGVEVWKAVRVRDRLPEIPGSRLADRVLFDSHVDGAEGGTGRRFDWSLLDGLEQPDRCLLGGGLGPDNAAEAQATGIRFLDVSTGVERAPGVKDPDRLAAFFAARRAPRRSLSCA